MVEQHSYLLRRFNELEDTELQIHLNALGTDGWRLVVRDGDRWVFMRNGYVTPYQMPSYESHLRRPRGAKKNGGLSPREMEVAQLVAEGLTNRGICDRLNLRDQNVKTIVSSAMRKLDVKNRTQLALRYWEIVSAGDQAEH